MTATQDAMLNLVLEFGGGTELLTSTKKTKVHAIQLPALVSPQQYKAKGVSMPESTAPTTAQANGQNGAQAETGMPSARRPTTMRDLVEYVCRDIVTERHGMLVEQDGSIRPGILVLINDADWELEGEMEYVLQDKDHICMISTLHGG